MSAAAGQFTAATRAGAVAVARQAGYDPAAAEDLAHDALVRAWVRRAQLADPAAFTGWLRRIVINECRRLPRRRPTLVDPAVVAAVRDGAAPVDARLDAARRWRAATVGLPAVDLAALITWLEDPTAVAGAARAAGLTLNGWRSRLTRARTQARARLRALDAGRGAATAAARTARAGLRRRGPRG